MSKEKHVLKDIIFVVFMIGAIFSLTGCSDLKSYSDMVKYAENKYNINVKVVSKEDNSKAEKLKERYNKVVLLEKDRNITFSVTSSLKPLDMDGALLGYTETTYDDYYQSLSTSIEGELDNIEKKYGIKLEYSMGLVSKIDYYTTEKNKDKQLKNLKSAINEIMKVYNLKSESDSSITIYINGENTVYYCKYTVNGKEVELINAEEEWKDTWNIPERLEEDVLKYVNSIYSGECYIEYSSIIPEYYPGNIDGDTYISYVIRNDEDEIKKEYRFNLDKYREDYNNNNLSSMDSYVKDVMEIVY